MAKSQYSADSARDCDTFPSSLPRPRMLSGRSHRNVWLSVADDGDPGTSHRFAPVGMDVAADASFTTITLHS